MTVQPAFPGLFDLDQGARAVQAELPLAQPATQKQLSYARVLAAKAQAALPKGIEGDRAALSRWIETHKAPKATGKFAHYPSSKQVAFAERIARLKRAEVPPECFRDRGLMSRWIDANKPR
ncbi:MAG: hypothetical protein AAF744_05855 [Pseudomonadota bacterium]